MRMTSTLQTRTSVSARHTRHQAAVVDAGRLLLLHCVPVGQAGFWVLPGGGREAGESPEACVAREVQLLRIAAALAAAGRGR